MNKRERERQEKRELDVNRITDGIGHPIRRRIFEAMLGSDGLTEAARRQWSPKELSEALDIPLTTMSYHVRELAGRGLIEEVDQAQRRGAIEHFYTVTAFGRKAREAQLFTEGLVS